MSDDEKIASYCPQAYRKARTQSEFVRYMLTHHCVNGDERMLRFAWEAIDQYEGSIQEAESDVRDALAQKVAGADKPMAERLAQWAEGSAIKFGDHNVIREAIVVIGETERAAREETETLTTEAN